MPEPRNPQGSSNLTSTIEHYSGSQVTVFVDDIWIDDAASFDISIQTQKSPYYGYGSQHFDLVAKGKVLVQGTLTINYKDPNYLWVILAHRDAKEKSLKRAEEQKKRDELNRPLASDLLVERMQLVESEEGFQNIADLYLEKYWNAPAKDPLIPEEPMNHRRFDLHFLYKGDSPGVIERVEGVELMGKAKTVVSSGEPVQEVYHFIARKLS